MNITKLSSACYNAIVSGLSGYAPTLNISIDQLEDEVCETKLFIIYKYYLKNLLPKKDLYYTLGCIQVDCKPISKCCEELDIEEALPHFEIPPIATCCGEDAIEFIGSIDKLMKFKVYLGASYKYHKYRTRRANLPYVYIDTSINANNRMDCWVFNAPLLEKISVTAIFADDRELANFDCCSSASENQMTSIDSEIKDTIVKRYFAYYRQYIQLPTQNDLNPK